MNSTFLDIFNETLEEKEEEFLVENNSNDGLSKQDLLFLITRYFLFILSALSDILIIYSYYKLKIIRHRNNVLLVHWAHVNLYYFLHQLIVADLICTTLLGLKSSPNFLVTLASTSLILTYVLAFAMLIRWTVLNIKHRLQEKMEILVEKYLIPLVYFLGVVVFISEYLYRKYRTIEIIVFIINTIVVVTVMLNILIVCSKTVKVSKTTVYILLVADTIVASVIPLIIYHYLFVLFMDSTFVLNFIFFTRIIPQLVLFGHPIIVLGVLFRFSKDFNTAFKLFLRTKQDYDNWIFIEEIET